MPSQVDDAQKQPVPGPRDDLFYRAITVRAADLDADERTVKLTFSSEARVQRWYGTEILRHGADNVDLKRLKTMGAALFNHSPYRIVGAVEGVSIGEDRRGHAVIRFDEDAEGNLAMGKVRSGSLRGISVGYLIKKARRITEDEEFDDPDLGRIKGPALIATRWEPIEISFTPIPADSDVGVGRDASRSLDGIEIEQTDRSDEEGDGSMNPELRKRLEALGLNSEATEEEAQALALRLLSEMPETPDTPDEPDAPDEGNRDAPDAPDEGDDPAPDADAISAARKEARQELAHVYTRADSVGQGALAMKLIDEGKDEREITDAVFEALAALRQKGLGSTDGNNTPKIDDMPDADFGRALSQPAAAAH